MARRIVFTGKQQLAFEPFEPDRLGDDQVLVRSLYTLMSTGTENIVFNRFFEPGTHWDRWVKYPFYPGYAVVGDVEQIGAGVRTCKPGDRVVARVGHASHHVCPSENVYPAPANLDPALAAWFALAKIAFMGARAAQFQIGGDCLVIGAGPIGQMFVRWASAAGLRHIIVADMAESRLALAKKGGASAVISKPIDQALEQVQAENNGRLPSLVCDTTGNENVFASALAACDRFGRVVVLGDTGSPGRQHLTSDVIIKGLTVVGAHDGHCTAEWNDRRIFDGFFAMTQNGRFNLDGLNTHTFKPEQCAKAYEIANTRRSETMGILFDWTN